LKGTSVSPWYKGKLGVNVEEAHHLMGALDWPVAKGREGARCGVYVHTGGIRVKGVYREASGGCIWGKQGVK